MRWQMWYGIKYPHNQRFLRGGGQNVALAKVCALLSARSSCFSHHCARLDDIHQQFGGQTIRDFRDFSILYFSEVWCLFRSCYPHHLR